MIVYAEALSTEASYTSDGKPLYCARVLPNDSEKYIAIQKIMECEAISFSLALHQMLDHALGCEAPLVIVTDWTDPREAVGLRLENGQEVQEYPELCFLALETNWEDLRCSEIEEIFAHELSHLWLHRMGYQPALSQSNRFHTSTAITDPFLAFLEGFAEHLEIVSQELLGTRKEGFFDNGYDLGAWLCSRDSALRVHGVKNNRFLYLTAVPEAEDFASYQQLHMAHITSSAFLPEHLKNGLQAVSSEGLIASFFYQMYRSADLKHSPAPAQVYHRFGCDADRLSPAANLYVKILWAMIQLDWRRETLFTDFVQKYLEAFEADRDILMDIFARVTNFVTVDPAAQQMFGEIYRVGRQGDMEKIVRLCKQAASQKEIWLAELQSGKRRLDDAIYKSIWIEADKPVRPVPWDSEHSTRLKINVNAATDVDFFALDGLTFPQCQELVRIREQYGGFSGLDEFRQTVAQIVSSGTSRD